MHIGELWAQLRDLFLINPTIYVKTAGSQHRPLLEILIVYFTYCSIINVFYYYIPRGLEKIKKFFLKKTGNKKQTNKKEKGVEEQKNRCKKNGKKCHLRKWRVKIKRTSRKGLWTNIGLYFIAGIIPYLYLVKETCLLSARMLRIPFYIFFLVNIAQFFLFYFYGGKIMHFLGF